MTKQTINIGANANDQSADTIRAAFDKVNTNFSEIYTAFGTDTPTSSSLKFVADDSTGTSLNLNETFKISGGAGITTAISGDELVITAAATGEPITFVGDDSTGVNVNSGNTLKITGTNGITTAGSQVTGTGTITLTGPNAFSSIAVANNSTVTASSSATALTFVGGDNMTILTSGNTITFHSTGNIGADDSTSFDDIIQGTEGRLAYYVEDGNTLAQTGASIDYNAVSEALTVKTFITNTISSSDSVAVTVNDGLIVVGNFSFDGGASVNTILDEDNMSSNSATALATQQSIKAYVDSTSGGTLRLGDSSSTSTTINVAGGEELMFRAGDSITPTVAGNGVTFNLNEDITVDKISAGDSTEITVASNIKLQGTFLFEGDGITGINAILDQDNLSANSATALATQQSIKAYVDSSVAGLTSTLNFSDSSSTRGEAVLGTNDLEFRSGDGITATVLGTGVTFALNKAIDVNTISSSDSTAVTVNDGLIVVGNMSFDGGVAVSTIVDEDNMASNSATALATQQSIKAYVDSKGITFARVGGNSTVASLGGTVSFQGVTNETTVAESSGTFTIGLQDDIAVNQIAAKDSSAVSITSPLQATTIQSSGVITAGGNVTATGSFVIGSADMNETDLEKLDGITNGTVAANKAVVVDGSKNAGTFGTVTATTFAGNVNSASGQSNFNNVQIAGNLTVNGTTTTIDTTNTTVEDNLLALNTGVSAVANTSDSGILINRGTGTDSSTLNVAMIWDESANEFALIETTEDGTNTGNINITRYANLQVDVLTGTATAARYADLAENYEADSVYDPGTVVIFGGDKEITVSKFTHDPRIAGVVSTNPAHLMNAEQQNGTAVALQGRVPCKVKGMIAKGDVLVASGVPGVACKMVKDMYEVGCVIGKALENHTEAGEGVIEVVVGRL